MWRSLGVLAVVAGLIGAGLWWGRGGAERTAGANLGAHLGALPDGAGAKPLSLESLAQPGTLAPGRALYDPLAVGPCTIVPSREQEVASQVDGTLREVAADLGQSVRPGQELARLDDRLLRPQVELLQIKAASDSARRIAQAQLDDVAAKVAIGERLRRRRAFPASELQTLMYQHDRALEEVRKTAEDQEVAHKELEKARQALDHHRIRSSLAGEVTKVCRRVGESVRQGEPLFWVANCDRVRVEGLCKVQQASLIRAGMRCLVEPEVRGEQLTELSGHTGTVTGLAVAADGRLVASASEDRTVQLWGWPAGTRRAVLPHPAEVHAVAFAPSAGGYRLLTGCADGRVRQWSLDEGGRLEGPLVLADGHEGAVRALAFSIDGRHFATGGEDRLVGVWDAVAGKRLYWLRAGPDELDMAHQGAVAWVQFTPDGQLVTAGRDNAVRVWRLGASAGAVAGVLAGRTGDVPHLGVSPDGRCVLFDHGEELRLLDRRDGGQLGALRARRQGRFHGFALFAPSGRLILTASNSGRLQLWTVPAGPEQMAFFRQGYVHGFGRDSLLPLGGLGVLPRLWALDGREVRHFLSPTPAPVTCGAFAPDGSAAFTAGTDRVIRVWAVPPAEQWEEPFEAVVTYVGSQVERGTDLVRVRAELDNPIAPARRLRPGAYAHLRVYPETAR
ncbi:MAG: efflux RND transporter periplasmic adaptor subunit [Gemmataceae bacterium]|nr:efflux RND transporter periplasmic adaptor subunit [Gemmataceae bacterium]